MAQVVPKIENLIKEEVFHLTQLETGITATDISANQISLWLQGWRFQVPVGQSLVFLPSDVFAIYAEDLTLTECLVADKFRILIKDASQLDAKLILGPCRYTQISAFTDRNLIKHLDISRTIIAKENEWVVIEGYMAVSLDVSEFYWD